MITSLILNASYNLIVWQCECVSNYTNHQNQKLKEKYLPRSGRRRHMHYWIQEGSNMQQSIYKGTR